MATLLLCLQGPLQSWGTTSRFDERDTQLEPSKSGVIGLICAALGRDRSQPVDDLANLTMGVRVDREGTPLRDYQTATGVVIAATGRADKGRTVVSPRDYLADAVFLVGLESEDTDLLQRIGHALARPVWSLALGRKNCVPSVPIGLPDGLVALPLLAALSRYRFLPSSKIPETPLRGMIEDPSEGSLRMDQPVAPFAERRFGPRLVKSVSIYVESQGAA